MTGHRDRRASAARIRLATPDDAWAIATVHVRSWQAAYRGIIPDDRLDGLSVERRAEWWGTEWWTGDAARRLLVAERPDAVVAFAAVGGSRDEGAGAATGELFAIYADPDAWGRGLGRALLAAATVELRAGGFTDATLWVLEENARARRFYEAAGWRPDGATQTDELGDVTLHEVRYRTALTERDRSKPMMSAGR